MEAPSGRIVVASAAEMGPSTTITNAMVTTLLEPILGLILVDQDTYFFTVDDSGHHSIPGYVNAVDLPFSTTRRTFFRESEAAVVPDPAGIRTGVADASSMFIGSGGSDLNRFVSIEGAGAEFLHGAQRGDDNWV